MDLYFLRHGDAVTNEDFNGCDADRPLTQKGKMQIRELAFLMTGQGVEIEKIFASPAKRTLDTAAIVNKECGWNIVIEQCSDLGLNSSPAVLVDFLNKLPPAGKYLLVGHEPTLGDTIRILTGNKNQIISVPKGNLFYIEINAPVEPGTGFLKWQIPITLEPPIS